VKLNEQEFFYQFHALPQVYNYFVSNLYHIESSITNLRKKLRLSCNYEARIIDGVDNEPEMNCFLFSITFLFPWREFFRGETHQDSDETGYRSVEIVARSGNLLHKTQLTICACLTRSEVFEQTSIAMSPVNPMASWSPHQFDMHHTMATNR
jgi:hypothetical protein